MRAPSLRRWVTGPVAAVVLLVTVVQQVQVCGGRVPWPRPLRQAYLVADATLWPLHSLNTYGLFRNMTTTRPTIILEGSADGQTWKPYEFPYQAGDPQRRPRFVEPHQPRLDWQMWFEALRSPGAPSDWFLNFCVRVLQGEPTVLQLLRTNPFPQSPPHFLRATVYDYRFTTLAERRTTGDWWKREELGPYCPVLSLRQTVSPDQAVPTR